MIGKFPEFNRLDILDRVAIQSVVMSFPVPHSEFNFATLWSNDLKQTTKVSGLNGNLLFLFDENKKHIGFLGKSALSQSLDAIFAFLPAMGLDRLSLVPQDVAVCLDDNTYLSLEDRDNFDYIIDTHALATAGGTAYSSLRGKSNKFSSISQELNILVSRPTTSIVATIEHFYHKSIESVLGINTEAANQMLEELESLKRLINLCQLIDLNVILAYFKDRLVGCAVYENLGAGYGIMHFMRADKFFSKYFPSFFWRESARILRDAGIRIMNIEQDLGIPGLQEKKVSLRPISFLKKYDVIKK